MKHSFSNTNKAWIKSKEVPAATEEERRQTMGVCNQHTPDGLWGFQSWMPILGIHGWCHLSIHSPWLRGIYTLTTRLGKQLLQKPPIAKFAGSSRYEWVKARGPHQEASYLSTNTMVGLDSRVNNRRPVSQGENTDNASFRAGVSHPPQLAHLSAPGYVLM